MSLLRFLDRCPLGCFGAVLLLPTLFIQTAFGSSFPTYLRCENLVQPLGLAEPQPRLSWEMVSNQRDERQTAYQIIVSSTPSHLKRDDGDLWDSGKAPSDETFGIEYQGRPLHSNERCYWKVRLWDAQGNPSSWSQPAMWSMGLMQSNDWNNSAWIGYDVPRKRSMTDTNFEHANVYPAVYLRSTFQITKKVERATLYATALGWFDARVNGRRVNETFFDPGWTDYRKRVYSRTYDVTSLIHSGANAWGAVLADGWYSGYIGWYKRRDHYGTKPRFRAQLHVEYADGSEADFGTGPDWKAATGPILGADILKGENYDARREIPGWDTPNFDADSWSPVNTGATLSPVIQPHPGPPIRIIQEFKAKEITEPEPGVYVLNLGQNFAGVARLKIRGTAGQKITLRFGERLKPDGTIYTANLRSATATDSYICRGNGVETWMPRFTYHGFQYIQITGLKQKPQPDTIVGMALSSDTPVVGKFDCDDPMLNKLHSNIYWTQRANFMDVPTDCPQRDERLGWTGDAEVFIRAATLNADVEAFFTKWLVDLQDAQRADGEFPTVAPLVVAANDGGPAWADAGVICPWTIYEVYGDRRELARHYPAMCRYIEFCRNRCTPDLLPPARFLCYGDWVNINDDTPRDVIYLAYFAHSTHLVALAAEVLGKTDDAKKWNALFQRIKESFNRAYVGPDGWIKGNTQCDYVLALAFNLLDKDDAEQAASHLVAKIEARGGHLSTGFVGTKNLMPVLTKIGRNDVALHLLHNDTYPSWGFSIKQGATTIWERWDGWTPQRGFQDPGMNSFDHYSFGAVYAWMAQCLGGIRTDGPAYKHIIIDPIFDPSLHHLDVGYHSVRGQIESTWDRVPEGLKIRVVVPANTTATVLIPAVHLDSITESGKTLSKAPGIKSAQLVDHQARIEIDSGEYVFLDRHEK